MIEQRGCEVQGVGSEQEGLCLTNRMGLPQAMVEAVKHSSYSKGDAQMSVTELLRPPRQVALERRYPYSKTEDVSDRIWSLLGQAIHTILERANQTAIAERRLSMEVLGWRISGGMDLYERKGVLTDYKVTSAWKLLGGDLREWTEQLNGYAALLRHHGDEVNRLQVVAILRDWSKLESRRNSDYPKAQVVTIPIELWSESQAQAFLEERVRVHQKACENLPECTSEERWAKPSVFAVMQAGRKKAVRLFQDESEALKLCVTDPQFYIVVRPGENVRCENYCGVSSVCDQYQRLKKEDKE